MQKQRKQYASSVKKPRIDEALKDKLLNEIKNPTSFMGRQSAHVDMAYSLHGGVDIMPPKSSHLAH